VCDPALFFRSNEILGCLLGETGRCTMKREKNIKVFLRMRGGREGFDAAGSRLELMDRYELLS
jgi:hypothetical protein